MCGFNLRDGNKNTELRKLLVLESAHRLGRVDYGGLDMLDVKMMHTGSSNVC